MPKLLYLHFVQSACIDAVLLTATWRGLGDLTDGTTGADQAPHGSMQQPSTLAAVLRHPDVSGRQPAA